MPFLDNINVNTSNKYDIWNNNKTLVTDISLNTEYMGVEGDIEVIKQSITNILLTQIGERLFNISFGTNLYKFVFDSLTSQGDVRTEIYNKVTAYEKRVNIENVIFTPDVDNHSIKIEILFVVKASSEWATWSETIYL